MIILAAYDNTIFDLILDNTELDRFTVSIATILASVLPMFFGIGFVKQSMLNSWQSIHHYEELLSKDAFWIMAVILLVSIIVIKITVEGLYALNFLTILGCGAFTGYLLYNKYRTASA